MMSGYKISVVIPTYNRQELLKKTIISLVNQSLSKEEFEVIICDDGSKDKPISLIEKFKKNLNIRYFYQEDKGFRAGAARNIGLKEAKGDIVLFLDTGVVLEENALANHFIIHKEYNEPIALIGYMYGFDELNENKQAINSVGINPNNVGEGIKKLKHLKIFDRREKIFEKNGENLLNWKAPWIIFWTGHLSVPRKECLELKGFDESLDSWGYEDIDLGIRWFVKGYKIIMSREVSSIHLPHDKFKSTLKASERREYSNKKKKILLDKYNLAALKLWMNYETIEIEEKLLEEQP